VAGMAGLAPVFLPRVWPGSSASSPISVENVVRSFFLSSRFTRCRFLANFQIGDQQDRNESHPAILPAIALVDESTASTLVRA